MYCPMPSLSHGLEVARLVDATGAVAVVFEADSFTDGGGSKHVLPTIKNPQSALGPINWAPAHL